ncbi:MAG: TIGR02444 family protein [Thermodesulfobacteriota bacterium]|nr:TIGR02444 family protein [Thermodesulfobacteriota bacterium]
MEFPEHSFWDFTLNVHSQTGIHEACLELQVTYGLDVNMLFFCCWVGSAGGGTVGREVIGRALEAVTHWQEEIVRPVWRARHRLKNEFREFPSSLTEPLRQALIAAEVDAEHIEQLVLAESFTFQSDDASTGKKRINDAASNLADYLALCSREDLAFSKEIFEPMTLILNAAFPEAERESVRYVLASALSWIVGS